MVAYSRPVHRSRNVQKAVSSLWGICRGVTADSELTDMELLYIDAWLKQNKGIAEDPDVIDLLDAVGDVLAGKCISQESLDDILQLMRDIVEYRSGLDGEVARMNELMGLVQGVMADGVLKDSEVRELKLWLDNMGRDLDWPASHLRVVLNSVLEDGVISDDERRLVKNVLMAMGVDFSETGSPDAIVTAISFDDVDIDFDGKRFCLSGVFLHGDRASCKAEIERLGGIVVGNVSKQLDYLVMGSLLSPDWIYSGHGRKLERAVDYRNRFGGLAIVSEELWVGALRAIA